MVEALGRNVDRDQADKVTAMTQYAGATVRAGDLFGSKNIFTRASLTNLKRQIGLQVSLFLFSSLLYFTIYWIIFYYIILYVFTIVHFLIYVCCVGYHKHLLATQATPERDP